MQEVSGIRVSLGLNTSEFTSSITDVNRRLRAVRSEFTAAGDGTREFANSLEGLRERNANLTRQLEVQRQKVAALRRQYDEAVAAQGASSRAAESLLIRYNNTVGAMRRTESQLSQTNQQIREQSSAWRRLGTAMTEANSPLVSLGRGLQSAGMGIATTFGAAAAAVGGALGASVKKSLDFGSQMSKVGAIAGATGKDLDKLKQSALDLGTKTSLSASQVAEAQTEMAKKGYNTNQIIAAMPGIISAAEASGEDLAMVADTVSSAINSFGLSASDSSHIADVLAKAANDSAAGIEDMQFAFKYAAAPAHALGMTMEELAASTEVMADSGIKGEQAGTTLRAALLRMVKPPKQAKEALKDLGVSIKDSHGKMLPFSNIIGQLNDKTKSMTNAQKTASLAAIFGTEAVSGMLAVVNAGPDKLDKLTQSLKDSDGASAKASKQMKDNLKGALDQLKGSVESAQIAIGDVLTPAIKKLASYAQKLTDKFNGLSPNMQKFIAIGGAVTAVVLAIVAALGVVMMAAGGVVAAWGALAPLIAPIGAVIATSLLPAIGIIAGIAGVSALLYTAWKTNFGGIRDFTSQVWGLVITKFNEVKAYIMPIIGQLVSYISERWTSIQPMVSQVMTAIGEIIKFILPFIFDTIKFYLDAIINVFKGAFNIIAGVIKFFVALFSGDWSGMWEAIKQVLLGAVQLIWGLFNLWFVGKIAGVIGGFVNKGIGFFAKFAGDALGWIGRFVGEGFSKIVGFGSNIVSRIGGSMSEFGGVIVRGLGNAIKSFADFAINAVSTVGSIVGKMTSIGVNIVKGIWSGISSMGSWLVSKLSSWALAVIPGPIAKVLGIYSPSRVLADKVGKWIPAGIAMGIENNINPLNKAVDMMSLAAVPTIPTQSYVYGGQTQSMLSNNSSSAAQADSVTRQPIIIQSVLNGKVIAEETYSDISLLINRANRSGARGKGVIMT